MKIAVLIKQIPLNAQAVFNEDNSINRAASVKGMNPADRCALLHAVALAGEGDTVTAVSMGPPSAEDTLREAVALGAGEGILLRDNAFAGSDTLATSRVLAAALRRIDPDLVLCGRRTVDGETGQVGPQLAVRLGMSCVANATGLTLRPGAVEARRLTSDRIETVEAPLPAVVTVMETLDVTALPSLTGLRRAAAAKILCWDRETLGLDPEICGQNGSPTSEVRCYTSESGLRTPRMLFTPEEGKNAILERLAIQ